MTQQNSSFFSIRNQIQRTLLKKKIYIRWNNFNKPNNFALIKLFSNSRAW